MVCLLVYLFACLFVCLFVCLFAFSASELNLMLNGRPDIDIEALRPYCIFQGNNDWHEMCETVLWLWQALREFNEEGRRNFLKFFTGGDRAGAGWIVE